MIGFEAHEGAELTIKNVLIGNHCYSMYYQYFCRRYFGMKHFPRTTDCFESTHNDLNVKCMEIKVHVPFIFNSQR